MKTVYYIKLVSFFAPFVCTYKCLSYDHDPGQSLQHYYIYFLLLKKCLSLCLKWFLKKVLKRLLDKAGGSGKS
jgi:hypothetical protein